jgi:hypothetical protein
MYCEQYIFEISFVTNFFKKKNKLDIKYFIFTPRNKYVLRFFYYFLRKFTRIDKLYRSFGASFGFSNVFTANTMQMAVNTNFNSKQELLNFSIDGIKIGDLIYDTYLRECSASTVDLDDKRLFWMIDNAISIYYSSKNYLRNNNVQKLILSHGVYLNYGIIARVAVYNDVDVYLFGHSKAIHKFSKDHLLQFIKHHDYSSEFKLLDNKEERRENARKILEQRCSGIVDQGIFYMESSAYAPVIEKSPKVFLNNGKTKVVMMLHCFFDSPHIYRNMIFPDFHEWSNFVLSTVDISNVDLVVKPHPNGKPGNGKIIAKLKEKFPNVRFIDKSTSNKQLILENVDVLLTVYGSVASEFAYHGVNVITAGDNPAVSYDFCLHAKDKDEYKAYLQDIENVSVNISKEKVAEFFYMHYLHVGKGRLENNEKVMDINWRIPKGDPNIFNDLVSQANNGLFDNTFDKISSALEQVE